MSDDELTVIMDKLETNWKHDVQSAGKEASFDGLWRKLLIASGMLCGVIVLLAVLVSRYIGIAIIIPAIIILFTAIAMGTHDYFGETVKPSSSYADLVIDLLGPEEGNASISGMRKPNAELLFRCMPSWLSSIGPIETIREQLVNGLEQTAGNASHDHAINDREYDSNVSETGVILFLAMIVSNAIRNGSIDSTGGESIRPSLESAVRRLSGYIESESKTQKL